MTKLFSKQAFHNYYFLVAGCFVVAIVAWTAGDADPRGADDADMHRAAEVQPDAIRLAL